MNYMNGSRILIIYSSRFGTTEEIAKFMENQISKKHAVDLINLDAIKNFNSSRLSLYEGVILGSGIKIAKWTDNALKFIEENRKFIQNNPEKVAIFVCCGLLADQKNYQLLKKKYLNDIFDAYNIYPTSYEIFAGRINMSKSSKLSFINKKIIHLISKTDQFDSIPLNLEGDNDYRDWTKINKFMDDFISKIP